MAMDRDTRDRIIRAADGLTDELVAAVGEMVRINTCNPYCGDETAASERPGQLDLQKRLESAGFVTRLFEPPPDVYERAKMIGPAGRSWHDRPNLVGELTLGEHPDEGATEANGRQGDAWDVRATEATRPSAPSPFRPLAPSPHRLGRTLVLNCHMDTVGAGGMTIAPFSGEVRDGRVWGRGSSDSKGNLAVGLFAVRALQSAGVKLNGRIVFESVVDEECNGGGAGTIACCLAGLRGDAAICLDGIGSVPIVGCNGVLTVELAVHGQAGHAALGAVNAIDKARVLADAMDALKTERTAPGSTRGRTEADSPPFRQDAGAGDRSPLAVNLGVFRAGSIPAIVPGEAVLAYNLTYPLAEAQAGRRERGTWGSPLLRERIEKLLADACAADDWLRRRPPTVTWVKDLYPFSTPVDAAIVRIVEEALEWASGRRGQPEHMLAWSDACHLSILGGMPTVGFGSATPGMAHADAECIEIDRLALGVRTVALAIARFFDQ